MTDINQAIEWWHLFGKMVDTEEYGPALAIMSVHPGKHPSEITDEEKAEGFEGHPYLASFDHEPTQAERDVLEAEVGIP